MAYKKSLVAAGLPRSEAIGRLNNFADQTFTTIYYQRFLEFSQRAGFVRERSLPDILIAITPENAKDKTKGLLRAYRIRRQWRVFESDLQNYLHMQRIA